MATDPQASSDPAPAGTWKTELSPAPANRSEPVRPTPPMAPMPPLFWFPGASPIEDTTTPPAVRARNEAQHGGALLDQGQYAAALACFQEAVRLQPDEPEYHCRLAAAAENAGRTDLLEPHLLQAVRIDPRCSVAHASLSQLYRLAGQTDLALHHSQLAIDVSPDFPGIINAHAHAHALFATRKVRGAWALIEPLVNAPGHVDRWVIQLYSRIAPAIGHEEQALAAIRRALETATLSADRDGRPVLHFAASGLLERLGRFREAFEEARAGNELIKSVSVPFDPSAHTDWVSRKVRYFTRHRLASLPRASHGNRRPVFVVGMPRSGTSLVEQILGSHPAVFPAGELGALGRVAQSLFHAEWMEGDSYPEGLDFLSPRLADRLAADYLAEIDGLDRGATYVTDKMPANALYLDLVQLLFPGARVIHCVRSAIDTCLSCYMTNFAQGNEFKLDLKHLGSYYRDHQRLMDHWKKVLGVPILEVRYEDVVLDTETQARRMLDFLELPWDEHCLRYYESPRRVNTASEDQVRRPIYTSSIGRWKHHEPHLGELLAAMGRSTPATRMAAG